MLCGQKNGILITKDHTVWILGSLCRFHRIPFDVSLLLQRHPPESDNYYTLSTFLHAVDELGFHHGESQNEAIDNFASLSLPCLAFKLAEKKSEQSKILDATANEHLAVDPDAENDSSEVACHFSANELKTKYGIVPQETRLLSGAVYENLHMAKPLVSFEEIIVACRWAEIHCVIEKLPQAYQTELGENGTGLSGGQKQRVSIACTI